ncbi:hypothetical protein G7083_07350 [Vibrio sp. HDW18]|uniref:hypothetical protein n=1 Tax=Vibrio sp. HDW18 TaxID=2714948 RepID=UPI001408C1A3|nr:hypothetical protein [Vibrio sp. HDW18]QIL85687.1 hypothetical protein G7083_07350 [Vibrio sp. HDW18]
MTQYTSTWLAKEIKNIANTSTAPYINTIQKKANQIITTVSNNKYTTRSIAYVHPDKTLSGERFSCNPIVMSLISANFLKYSSQIKAELSSKVREIQIFTATTIKTFNNTCSALKIVDTYAGDIPDKNKSIMAYWVPQGGYVDIPIKPDLSIHPIYVFTPAFSGCTFVIDKIYPDTLRVRHVEGGKEQEQYNDKNIEHGEGIYSLIEFNDYGYYKDKESKKVIQNTYGFAFLKFDEHLDGWNIHLQKQIATPVITSIEKKGLLNRDTATIYISEKSSVQGTKTINPI